MRINRTGTIVLGGALLAAAPCWAQGARTDTPTAARAAGVAGDAAKVLAELEAHEALKPGPQPRTTEAEAYAVWASQNSFYNTKRAKLIGDLWRADPKAPQLKELMTFRWQNAAMLRGVDVTGEIEAFAKHHPDASEAVQTGRFILASNAINAWRTDAAKAEAALNDFLKAYPDDPRGATLLANAARLVGDEEKALGFNKRLASEYANTDAGRRALGQIRQAEGVGKTFELAFTDHLTGKPISMDELRGKVVVIDFWATWCGPCIAEMPKMKELYAKYKDQGVEFIGVSLDQPADRGGDKALTKYCEENGITWPQYYQGNYWQSEFSVSWGINAIPALFIVDKEGKLHSTKARGQLERMIPELLAK